MARCKILTLRGIAAALVSNLRAPREPSVCWDESDSARAFLSVLTGMVRAIHLSPVFWVTMVLRVQTKNGVPTCGDWAIAVTPVVVNVMPCQSPLPLWFQHSLIASSCKQLLAAPGECASYLGRGID